MGAMMVDGKVKENDCLNSMKAVDRKRWRRKPKVVYHHVPAKEIVDVTVPMNEDHRFTDEDQDQKQDAMSKKSKKDKKDQYHFSACVREDHHEPIYSLSFCTCIPEYENYFASVGHNRVSIYECLKNGHLNIVQAYVDGDKNETYFACTWAMDVITRAPLVLTSGGKGQIKVINLVTQSVVLILYGHGNSVNALQMHPVDGNLLFSASKDESIRLWNVLNGVCVAVFAGHHGHRVEVLSVDVHLNGLYFVSSGMDNTIKLWDLEEERIQSAIKNSYTEPKPKGRPFKTEFVQFPLFTSDRVHADYIDCVKLVGDLILSKSTANKLLLWKPNLSRGSDAVTILREYVFEDADIWWLHFCLDPEHEKFVVGNKVGVVYIWDIDSDASQPIARLSHQSCKTAVRETSMHRSGRILIYGCDDGSIYRFDQS